MYTRSRRASWWIVGGSVVLLACCVGASVALAQRDAPPKPPLGLPPVYWPDDNPYSRAKAELGRTLFFDKRLSSDGTISCASCHDPARAFTDAAPVATGIGAQKGTRSVPTVINCAYGAEQFWDGRAPSLEEQAKGPLANPLEMTREQDPRSAHEACAAAVRAIRGYRPLFRKAFGKDRITISEIAKAVATFERTIYSGNSPYDRFQAGDRTALTEEQQHGMQVFFDKAACDSCHLGANFTDGSYVNIGIGMDRSKPDLGRYLVTRRDQDRGAFKVPTLREIAHTAPYMHDGRFKTLEQVVEHYDKGGIPNPYLDRRMQPLHLTPHEKRDLVEFLNSLSGDGWQQVQPPTSFPQ